MSQKGLTAKQVEHAQPRETRYEIPGGDGLYLVVHPTGRKGWAFRYRWQGKTRNMTFTTGYPEMTLAAARAEAESALEALEEGRDPAYVQAEEEKERNPDTVEAVADEWIARHLKVNVKWPDAIRILKNNIVKPWKHKLITDVSRADVLRVLDAVVDRGAAVQANRTLGVLRAWLNWCVDRGILSVSPANGVKPPTTEQSRDRVLTVDELSEIWSATNALGHPFGPWVQFLILTAQRRSEVARIKWQDVKGNLWTLPKEETKAGRVHDVPLSPPAEALFAALPRFTGAYAFTTTSGETPISGFSKAKTALDTAIMNARKKRDPKAKPIARWTYHDLRRTAATWMAANNVAIHVVSAVLNHAPGSTMGITAIYARHRYFEERRGALKAWGEFIVNLGLVGRLSNLKVV